MKTITVESSKLKTRRDKITITTRDTIEQFLRKLNDGIYFMTVFSDDAYVEKNGKVVGVISESKISFEGDKTVSGNKFKLVCTDD